MRAELPLDTHPARWRTLARLAAAVLLGMSPWFAASAVGPLYQTRWGLTTGETAWLTSIVQLGFVAGTALSALLNLADIIPAARLFAWSALLASSANTLLLTAGGLESALAWRFLTGMALAGVYPPAMKMVATWFLARRGLAVGSVVGALTIGKALPYLVTAIPGASLAAVILATSGGALMAAALVARGYTDGPHPFPSRPFSWGLVGEVVRQPRWRLATGGYLGHMWELYAAWTWLPVFLGASFAAAGASTAVASAVGFAALAVGGVGCLWGGVMADRYGRGWLVSVALAASGACALLIGGTFGRAPWLTTGLALLWGFFVIADSAQFSVLVTESVPPHAVGTALTLQTSLGFLLTTASVQLMPQLAEAIGWRWAFVVLAVGPALGLVSIRQLGRLMTPRAVAP